MGYGDLIITYPKPYSIYFRGNIGFGVAMPDMPKESLEASQLAVLRLIPKLNSLLALNMFMVQSDKAHTKNAPQRTLSIRILIPLSRLCLKTLSPYHPNSPKLQQPSTKPESALQPVSFGLHPAVGSCSVMRTVFLEARLCDGLGTKTSKHAI